MCSISSEDVIIFRLLKCKKLDIERLMVCKDQGEIWEGLKDCKDQDKIGEGMKDPLEQREEKVKSKK